MALLGDRRMAVHADAEHGFRVEGLFRLSLENENARRFQTSERLDKVVAGARSDRLHTLPRRLLLRMQFSS